jgi:hypothetical protein
LASYCMVGAVLYGWSGLIIPKTIKGPGFELDAVEREITNAKDQGLEEIRNESAAQQKQISQLNSELLGAEKAVQQSRDDLRSEIEQANAVIGTLKTEQNTLNASVGRLNERMKARVLSQDEQDKLRAALCKTPYAVGFESVAGEEPVQFMEQIHKIFISCKWTIAYSMWDGREYPDGTEIDYSLDSPQSLRDIASGIGRVLQTNDQVLVLPSPDLLTQERTNISKTHVRPQLAFVIGRKVIVK